MSVFLDLADRLIREDFGLGFCITQLVEDVFLGLGHIQTSGLALDVHPLTDCQ